MGEDDAVNTSGESGGTDVTVPDTSRTTVEVNPSRRILIAIGLATLLVVGLLGVTGWATMQHGWSLGRPWWYGFQLRYVATPIAAFTAAIVAITTAWWTVRSTRAISAAEHRRWETDRKSENARRTIERQDAIERTLRDRFHELVKLLGSEDLRAREGAAYAVAALADDWAAHYVDDSAKARAEQQVCINVLISQLRDSLPPTPVRANREQLLAFKHAIQHTISSRLGRVDGGQDRPGIWSSFDFAFDGCTFHNLELDRCIFDGGPVSFGGARFTGEARFNGAQFTGTADFDGARFTGEAWFNGAKFTGEARFIGARFTGEARFNTARFAGEARFNDARFAGDAWFIGARFTGEARFNGAKFTGTAGFIGAQIAGRAGFGGTQFRALSFANARFAAGATFGGAQFTGSADFDGASFAGDAGFGGAHFGGIATFKRARFARVATFGRAHFTGRAVFDDAQFVKDALFAGAHFTGEARFEAAHFTGGTGFRGALFASSRVTFEKAFARAPRSLDRAYFDVSLADFPECEVCDALRANQTSAPDPEDG